MLRDVLITSINKGQFPLAIFGLILLTVVGRMPQKDLSVFMFQVLDKLVRGYLLGYLLAGGLSVGWLAHAKWQRKSFVDEIDRMAGERDKSQQRGLGNKVVSSKKSRTASPLRNRSVKEE